MVPLVPTFLPMVTLARMVPLAAEKRSGFSGYQWYHWLPMVPLVKFPVVPLGEFRTHAMFVGVFWWKLGVWGCKYAVWCDIWQVWVVWDGLGCFHGPQYR